MKVISYYNGRNLTRWFILKPLREQRRVVIQYIVATLDMAREGAHHYSATDITIPYIDETMPEQEILFENVTGANCFALVGMAIRYYRNTIQNNPVNIMRWKPAGIAGSFYN